MPRIPLPVLILVWIVSSAPAFAIVIRDDVADSAYVAGGVGYPAVAKVGPGLGVLIDPFWILTAAHVVDEMSPLTGVVEVAGRPVLIRRVVFHPTWVGDLGPGLAQPDWIDLALLELVEPVRDLEPIALFDGVLERDSEVVFVGDGQTGTGSSGPTESDGRWRGATNLVERFDAHWLYFDFDEPASATPLEGISGPGDSGGPALVSRGERIYLAGIGSRNIHEAFGLSECVYGTEEMYARVSPQRGWIESVVAYAAVDPPLTLVDEEWPPGPAFAVVEEFFTAFNAGSEERLVSVFAMRMAGAQQARIDAEDRAGPWLRLRRRAGVLIPTHFAQINAHKLEILARGDDAWRVFRFELEGVPAERLRSVKLSRTQSMHGTSLGAPTMAVEVASLAEVRRTVEQLRPHGFDRAEVAALADAVVPTLHGGDIATRLSLLREIAEVCWEGPALATRRLRWQSIEQLVGMVEGSRRARIMLTTMFLPPLHRVPVGSRAECVADFTTFLQRRLSAASTPQPRADLLYLMASLRLQVHRAWDAPWLDDPERAFVDECYQVLIDDYGELSAPSGGGYAEVARGEQSELRSLRFGEAPIREMLEDLDGRPLSRQSLSGKTVALSFWASWCIPCLQLVPEEKEMVGRLALEPFEFVGICADPTATQGRKTAERVGMPWRNVWDPPLQDALASRLNIRQWPSALILDGDGKLRAKFVGSIFQPPYDTAQLEAAVRRELSAAAR